AELPPPLQAKLLTTLEDGEVRRVGAERAARVDARIIAATNTDLPAAVRARTFRADLYHRLMILAFRIPPLRDRGNDVDLLLRTFLDRFALRYGRSIRGYEPAAGHGSDTTPGPATSASSRTRSRPLCSRA